MNRAANLTLYTCLAAACAHAQSLADTVNKLLEAPAAQRATWGIHAVDLATGRVLLEKNSGVPMTPASNTKLFSSALALLRLGPAYRFETLVLGPSQPNAEGRLAGDLRLVGGGDPTLSARAVPYRKGPIDGDPLRPLAELADQIVQSGVRLIEGDLIGDDTRWPWQPYPDGWSVGDMVWEYGAPVSALVLNDNAITVTIRPGKAPGDTASVTLNPPVDHFTIYNSLRTVAGAQRKIVVDRLPASRVLQITGTAAPNGGAASQLIAVDDPALFAAEALAQLLRDRGVVIQGSVRAAHRTADQPYTEPAGTVLARRTSPPLTEILRVINKVSQNLHVEMVLREVGRLRLNEGTAGAAQKDMTEFLTSLAIDPKDHSLEDGSGLSRRTLVTPSAITTLLRSLHLSEHRDTFFNLLPIAGEDGTLASRFRGVANASEIHAKTGSVSHVAALAGYAGPDPGRRIAFSILVNGFTAPSSEIRSIIDKIAVAILEEGKR